MRRVLLDSNALDPLMTLHGAYEKLRASVDSGDLEIVFTHVTVDEMAAISDLEKRQRLLVFLIDLGHMILTAGACLDFSRLDFCRVMADGDVSFEMLRSYSVDHSRDALIAHTALVEECALVTNDRRLAARARDLGTEVFTTVDLLAVLGFAPNSTAMPG
jgi:predicted nucleic acid-binding protein